MKLFPHIPAKRGPLDSPWVKGGACSGPCLPGLGLVTLTDPDVIIYNVSETAVCWELLQVSPTSSLPRPCEEGTQPRFLRGGEASVRMLSDPALDPAGHVGQRLSVA